MMKRRLTATKKSQASRRIGKPAAVRSASPGRVVAARKWASVFRSFVATDTPAAAKIDVIRGGVLARVVDDMAEYLDVPKNVIFAVLHTPESTAHRLIKDNRHLDSAASERVVRVADITRMAEETFGGRDSATQWLKSQNLALGGETPLSMLDTEPGAGEVRRLLHSINYGGVF